MNIRVRISPVLIVAVTILVDLTGFGMIIPLIPFYATRLGASPTSIGVLVASFSIMQVLFSPILGRISDSVGRRPVLLFSILTSFASFALFAVATSFEVLLLSRIVAGLATEAAVAQAYIADITTKDDRVGGIGKVSAAFGIGFIVGPAIGGLLSPYGYWAPGAAAALLALANFAFVLLFLPESLRKRDPLRLPRGRRSGIARRLWGTLTQPVTGPVYAIYFVVTLAFAAIPVIVPLLTVAFYGFTAVETSYLFVYIGVLQVVLQGAAIGRLAKTLDEGALLLVGALLLLVGMFTMPLLRNVVAFFASLTLLSLGIGLVNTVVPSFLSKRTPTAQQGRVLGATQSIASIARVPGPLLGGFFYDYAGVIAPFVAGSAMLVIPVLLSGRVHQLCTASPQGRDQHAMGRIERPRLNS